MTFKGKVLTRAKKTLPILSASDFTGVKTYFFNNSDCCLFFFSKDTSASGESLEVPVLKGMDRTHDPSRWPALRWACHDQCLFLIATPNPRAGRVSSVLQQLSYSNGSTPGHRCLSPPAQTHSIACIMKSLSLLLCLLLRCCYCESR